jgi:uncharacterized membrane protein
MLNENASKSRLFWEDLVALLLLPVLICLSTYVWPHPLVRTVSGFAYILVAPGYSLLAAIFPNTRTMGLASRVGLSMGVSIALTTIVGLFLNYTLIGISSASALIAVTAVVIVCAALAFWRRIKAVDEFESEDLSEEYSLIRKLPWALGLYIGFVILFSVMGWGTSQASTTMASDAQEHFTEFFVTQLDPYEETRENTFLTGEPVLFTLTAINREGVDSAYRVVVIGAEGEEQIIDFQLEPGERWREVVVVVNQRAHRNAKVSFILYKQGITKPYRSLYIWTTIVSPE